MRGCTCHGLTLCPWCQALAARAVGSGVAGARGREGGDTPAIARPLLTEKAFQAAVVRLAKEAGYTFAYHTYRSTKSQPGFPDLILAHRDAHRQRGWPIWAVELKTDTGEVTPAQAAWLEALAHSRNVVTDVWRPRDWDTIVARLRG